METSINEDTKDWITEIDEDTDGNMWFARDGYGACKFDGDVFAIYKEWAKNIWISTTKNGVYKYNGQDFKNYSVPISITNIR